MRCDMGVTPMIGLLSQVMHLGMWQATQLFGQYDLKPGQAGILFILNRDGELSQRELATKLNLTPPSITAAIQKMEKLGYICRQPDPKDQRVLRLSLTDKSRTYLEHIIKVSEQMEETLLRGISPEEKMLLRRLLLQMKENLSEGQNVHAFRPPL